MGAWIGAAVLFETIAGTARYGSHSDVMRNWRAFIGADKNGDTDMRSVSAAFSAENADAPVRPMQQFHEQSEIYRYCNRTIKRLY
jgi:hypothetical protein